MRMMKTYIVLPDVQIHNANAMSSYTIGFPAMTAWLGAVHALQRNLAVWDPVFSDIVFSKTAVVCRSCHLQVQKGYRNSIIGTANPLKKKGGAYERPPFIAEARVHVTVTLVIETSRVRPEYKERCEHAITMLLPTMKIASGDVLNAGKAEIVYIDEEKEYGYKPLIAKMMPGYVLIEAELTGELQYIIRNEVPHMSGFLTEKREVSRSNGKVQEERIPIPLRDSEVKRILGEHDEAADSEGETIVDYAVGEAVKITDGPFSGFDGTVEEIVEDRSKLKVMVVIFGRKTLLELNFTQVTKE